MSRPAIEYAYVIRQLTVLNGPTGFESLNALAMTQTGRVEMWRGSSRFGLSDPPLSSGGAQVALP
jgi:hypothetical protein